MQITLTKGMQTLELDKTNEQRTASWAQACNNMQLLKKQKQGNQKKPTEPIQVSKQTKGTDTITA